MVALVAAVFEPVVAVVHAAAVVVEEVSEVLVVLVEE